MRWTCIFSKIIIFPNQNSRNPKMLFDGLDAYLQHTIKSVILESTLKLRTSLQTILNYQAEVPLKAGTSVGKNNNLLIQ